MQHPVDEHRRIAMVAGYFGADNFGDEFLLRTITRRIAAIAPDVELVIAAHDGPRVHATTGLAAFSRSDADLRAHWVARASALVIGPGGLWNDYGLAAERGVSGLTRGSQRSLAHAMQIVVESAARGIPVRGFGLGVGPLRLPDAGDLVRLAGRLIEHTSVRDTESLDILTALGFPREGVEQAPDLGYAARLPERSGDRDRLVIVLRDWDGFAPSVALVRAAVRAARRLDVPVIALAAQPRDLPVVEAFARKVEEWYPVEVMAPALDGFVQALGRARVLVSMRLHAALVAHRMGTPVVGLAYDPKLNHHFSELGVPQLCLPLSAGEDQILGAIEGAAVRDSLETIDQRLQVLERSATAHLDKIARWIRDIPLTPARPNIELLPHRVQEPLAVMKAGGRNVLTPNLAPRIRALSEDGGRVIGIDASAPNAGDEAYLEHAFPSGGRGWRVGIRMSSSYREDELLAGRMAHFVSVGGRDVVTVDVARWTETSELWMRLPPRDTPFALRVGVRALRDCEEWNWGLAGMLAVHSLVLVEDEVTEAEWACSIPHSRVRVLPLSEKQESKWIDRMKRKKKYTQ